jgi:type II restriction enzyme
MQQFIGDLIPPMNLSMRGALADRFKSGSQKAGNVTEAWGADNFYCPNCPSPKLDWLKPSTKASDYKCPNCGFWYQLKSKKSPIGKSIRDGAYRAMMEAIQQDRAPSYFFLHYEITPSPLRSGGEGRGEEAQINSPHPASGHLLPVERGEGMLWVVRNLLLVPYFAFPPSAIIKCPPLAPTARRAGWVGCNFDLRRVPVEARIEIISTRSSGRESAPSNQSRLTSAATIITPPAEVRAQFRKVKPFQEISVKDRGWILDVYNIVQRLGKKEFSNADVYASERELEQLHPGNRHIRDKIRQKLQILRDRGFLIQPERGLWRLP